MRELLNSSWVFEREKNMIALMRERYSVYNHRGKALRCLWVDLKVTLS